MRVFILTVLSALALVHCQDYSCPKGKSKTKKIVLSPGDSFSYNTNFDDKYYPKTKCPVVYKANKKCKAGIRFSCDSFDLPNRDSAKCRKGDRLILGKKAYCGSTAPDAVTLTGKAAKKGLRVLFASDKKNVGDGAQCTAVCLEGAATTTTAAPTTTAGSGGGSGGGSRDEYCAIAADHTMCLHEGPSDSCSSKTVLRELSSDAQQAIVDKHNELRRKIAKGEETSNLAGGNQPPASNMRKLVWNDELAVIAQRWADQCTFDHDDSRHKADGTKAGQNLFLKGSSNQYTFDELMQTVADESTLAWYLEVESPGYNSNDIDPFKNPGAAGHYTQVVWAETEEIGCGFTYYNEKVGPFNAFKQLVVCNYAKNGNTLSKAMYLQGEACSQCSEGYSCEDGLCAKN